MELVTVVEEFPEDAHLEVSLLEERTNPPAIQKVLGQLAGDYSGLSNLREKVDRLTLSKETIKVLTGIEKYDPKRLVLIGNHHQKDYSLALGITGRNCYYPLAQVKVNGRS